MSTKGAGVVLQHQVDGVNGLELGSIGDQRCLTGRVVIVIGKGGRG